MKAATPPRKFTAAQERAPHRFMAVMVLVLALGFFSQLRGSVANVFVSQAGAGTQSGATCNDAKPVTFFNTGGNWGGGGAQIGPDTVVHLCGTFTGGGGTSMLTVQGNGTSGHQITILAESGAVLTAPYWPIIGGAINVNGHAFITVDGGTNGTIQATANGTLLANQQDTRGIDALNSGADTTIVQNWKITNLYIRQAMSTDGHESIAISLDGSHSKSLHNTIDHARVGTGFGYCGQTDLEIAFNTVTFSNHEITVGDNNTGCTMATVRIHDNDFGGGAYLWDSPGNDFHHNAAHLFAVHTGSTITDVILWNNYVHGTWGNDQPYFNSTGGTHITAAFFFETIGPGILTFNNVIDMSNPVDQRLSLPSDGFIFYKGGAASPDQNSRAAQTYNNTTIVHSNVAPLPTGPLGICIRFDSNPPGGHIEKNNICANVSYGPFTPAGDTSVQTSDYNDWFNMPAAAWGGNPNFQTLAQWQAALGPGTESHSVFGNPLLNASTYVPQAGSAAINTGINLAALGIPLLNLDKNGNLRSPTGNWTMGALNPSSGAVPAVCISPASPIPFPSTTIFTNSSPVTVTVTNCGNAPLVLNNNPVGTSGTNGADFIIAAGTTCTSLLSIPQGQHCLVNVTFRPTVVGTENAVLGISGNATGSAQLTGAGTAASTPAASVTPNPVPFGNQVVSTTHAAITAHIASTGTANLVLGPSFLSFSSAEYARSGGDCANNGVYPPGTGCDVGVTFTPVTTGNRNGTMSVASNATTATTALTGAGTSPAAAAYTITPTTFNFGSIRKGTPSTLHNFSIASVGGAPLVMNSTSFFTISGGTNPTDFARVSPGGSDCINGHTYNPGDPACLISVAFTPSTTGAETATLSINANVPGPTAALSGTGIFPALTATPPGPVNFGSINQGSPSAPIVITFRNTGTDTEHLAATAVTITGDYSVSATNCTNLLAIAINGTCNVSVVLTPTGAGTRTGTLTVHGDVSLSISLTGSGIATAPLLNCTPRPVQFPDTNVGGTSSTIVATCTNNGNALQTFSGSPVIVGTEFAITGTDCGATLAATASCHYNMIFTPSAAGLRTSTMTVNGTSQDVVQLRGTGFTPGQPGAPIPFFMSITLPAGTLRCSGPGSHCNPIGLRMSGQNFMSTTKVFVDGAAISTSCTSSVLCSATLPASMVSLPGFGTSSHTISVK